MCESSDEKWEGSIPVFITKLWEMAASPKVKSIEWNCEGTAVQITQEHKSKNPELKKYFKTGNHASFVRQLNMYQFKKVQSYWITFVWNLQVQKVETMKFIPFLLL